MATTLLSTQPMKAVGGISQGTVRIMHFPAGATAFAAGDVVVLTSGLLVPDNSTPPAVGTIVGVALGSRVATNDMIPVALAMPGQLFEANIVDDVTDEVGVFADNIGKNYGIIESADGHACIDLSETAAGLAPVRTLRYAKQANATQDTHPQTGGVGVTNPRVQFVFISSVFTGIATNIVV